MCLKPLMLGRGLEVPMPVILIGVIGGMIADGLLGIFVGPVMLAVGFVLLMSGCVSARLRTGPRSRSGAHDHSHWCRPACDVVMPRTPGAGFGAGRALFCSRCAQRPVGRKPLADDLPAILGTDDRAHDGQYRPGSVLGAVLSAYSAPSRTSKRPCIFRASPSRRLVMATWCLTAVSGCLRRCRQPTG